MLKIALHADACLQNESRVIQPHSQVLEKTFQDASQLYFRK